MNLLQSPNGQSQASPPLDRGDGIACDGGTQLRSGQSQNPALDGSGLNQNAAQQAGSVARAQLEANSKEERDEVRANATSIGAEAWDTLDDAVMQPLRDKLVLDQLFMNNGMTYDLQWWQTQSTWKIRGKMGPAEHTTDLRTRSEMDTLPEGKEGIAIPYSIKDYDIYEGDIRRAQATGVQFETDHANEAGRSVANLVEDTYLYGSKIQLTTVNGFQLGCPGMLNVQGRFMQTGSGTWGDGTQATADVNAAIAALNDANYDEGPAWLLHGTEQDNQFAQDYKPTVNINKTTREKLEGLSRLDRMVHVPRMPDGEAVLMRATTNVMDAARLPDGPLNIEWETHGEMQHKYKVYHLAAPRFKHHDDGSIGIVHIAGIGDGA